MSHHFKFFLFLMSPFIFISCSENDPPKVVKNFSQLNASVSQLIQKSNETLVKDSGKYSKEISLDFFKVIHQYYKEHNDQPTWSDEGKFNDIGNSMLGYLDTAIRDGLLKEAYHYKELVKINDLMKSDTTQKLNAEIWAKADFLLSDAFFHVLSDLKQGRLVSDSASWKNDESQFDPFFITSIQTLKKEKQLSKIFTDIQPSFSGYIELKKGIQSFVDSMNTKEFTFIEYPYAKSSKADSLTFFRQLQKRLGEEGYLECNKNNLIDSVSLSKVIIKYQNKKKLEPDGKIGSILVNSLNLTDAVKLKVVMITLDRYKLLPRTVPEQYVLVNLPSYQLQVWDKNQVALSSKIICGKPTTPTPFLAAEIDEIVIYPTWTVPSSIISKELLPGLKKNASFLSRKGLGLYDNNGERLDPGSINWEKYKKGIPYKIMQSSGDDNALGVMKFNFNNPYSVYLHDTNQRGLFNKRNRALSHGCVRVENWRGLANYIASRDSASFDSTDVARYNIDSLSTWLQIKVNRRVKVKNKLPLFIKYFTCEGNNGKIVFYDDIYGEDKRLLQQFFLKKNR